MWHPLINSFHEHHSTAWGKHILLKSHVQKNTTCRTEAELTTTKTWKIGSSSSSEPHDNDTAHTLLARGLLLSAAKHSSQADRWETYLAPETPQRSSYLGQCHPAFAGRASQPWSPGEAALAPAACKTCPRWTPGAGWLCAPAAAAHSHSKLQSGPSSCLQNSKGSICSPLSGEQLPPPPSWGPPTQPVASQHSSTVGRSVNASYHWVKATIHCPNLIHKPKIYDTVSQEVT